MSIPPKTDWYSLPVRDAQSLNTSVHRQSIGHMSVVEPESRGTHLFMDKKVR